MKRKKKEEKKQMKKKFNASRSTNHSIGFIVNAHIIIIIITGDTVINHFIFIIQFPLNNSIRCEQLVGKKYRKNYIRKNNIMMLTQRM